MPKTADYSGSGASQGQSIRGMTLPLSVHDQLKGQNLRPRMNENANELVY